MGKLGVILLAALIVLILAVGPVLDMAPGVEHVIADKAFVYPDGEQIVLVLASGEYAVEGSGLDDGYYLLSKAEPGARRGTRGTAKRIW